MFKIQPTIVRELKGVYGNVEYEYAPIELADVDACLAEGCLIVYCVLEHSDPYQVWLWLRDFDTWTEADKYITEMEEYDRNKHPAIGQLVDYHGTPGRVLENVGDGFFLVEYPTTGSTGTRHIVAKVHKNFLKTLDKP